MLKRILLIAAVAFAWSTALAQSIGLPGTSGIAPQGSRYDLWMQVGYSASAQHIEVRENGTLVPGCEALVPDGNFAARCVLPTMALGWHQFDIVDPASGSRPAAAATFWLFVVEGSLPTTTEIKLVPYDLDLSYEYFLEVRILGPLAPVFPGDPAPVPTRYSLPDVPPITLDGAPYTCVRHVVVPFSSCEYSFVLSRIAVGHHALAASFAGDTVYGASAASYAFDVNGSTTLGFLSPSYVRFGKSLVIVVSSTANRGTIAFTSGGTALPGCEAVPVVNLGAACVFTPVASGRYQIVATSTGPLLNTQGIAMAVDVFDGVAGTQTTVTTSGVASEIAPRTITATVVLPDVAPAGQPPPPASGTVAFYANDVAVAACAQVPLDRGIARCTAAKLHRGENVVTAVYGGTDDTSPSANATAALVVARPTVNLAGSAANDMVFQRADGAVVARLSSSGTFTQLFAGGSGWVPTHAGDFNGDGKADLLFSHPDGRVAIWLMNGITQVGGGIVLPAATGWAVTHVADFDGDGKADILWQHTDGRVAMWLMDGTTIRAGASLLAAGTGWHPRLVDDFDRDGRADILWTHDDGSAAIWLMNGGVQAAGARLFGGGTGWSPAFLADFNGDGKADILWTHTDGRAAMWLMDGLQLAGAATLLPAGTGFRPVAAADSNLDLRADIFWERADGRTAVWLMDGLRQVAGGDIFAAGSGLRLLQAADFSGGLHADLLAVNGSGDILLYHWVPGTVASYTFGPLANVSAVGTPVLPR